MCRVRRRYQGAVLKGQKSNWGGFFAQNVLALTDYVSQMRIVEFMELK
jgi:hypothetical protein